MLSLTRAELQATGTVPLPSCLCLSVSAFASSSVSLPVPLSLPLSLSLPVPLSLALSLYLFLSVLSLSLSLSFIASPLALSCRASPAHSIDPPRPVPPLPSQPSADPQLTRAALCPLYERPGPRCRVGQRAPAALPRLGLADRSADGGVSSAHRPTEAVAHFVYSRASRECHGILRCEESCSAIVMTASQNFRVGIWRISAP